MGKRVNCAKNEWTSLNDHAAYDGLLHKEIRFGGRNAAAPHLGVKSPKSLFCGAWISVFKPNAKNIATFMLSNLLRPVDHHLEQVAQLPQRDRASP